MVITISLIVHDDFSHIGQALDCLAASTNHPLRLVVTVNRGSSDQVRALAERYPAAAMHTNAIPKGFAANHNAILQRLDTPFAVLLNDDALLQPGSLDTMLSYLALQPAVGIVGPFVCNPDGTPQISVFSDPTLLRMLYQVSGLGRFTRQGGRARRWLTRLGVTRSLKVESLNQTRTTRVVPVVAGVCMVVRREAIEEAGFMDEDTRVYGEEFGWQRRMRAAGWKAALVADAEVIHLNPSQDLTGWKLAEHRKGMLNYFVRYQPQWQTHVLRVALVFFHGLYAAFWFPLDRAKSRAHQQAALVGLKWEPQR